MGAGCGPPGPWEASCSQKGAQVEVPLVSTLQEWVTRTLGGEEGRGFLEERFSSLP